MHKVEDVRYDILKSVSEATSNLLPSKSKEKYEQCYRLFCQWRTDEKLHGNDENIVLAHFYEKSKSLAKLKGSKYFSKLDANSGFYQIRLESESQYLTPFTTPFERDMFKRLPFGVS